jgi:GT2 family glycosyltransferase
VVGGLSMVELSIILVNWNCIAFTEQCLTSIQANVTELDYEVIVVDNDSADAPCSSLSLKFPWVELILSKQNVGFGRANNLGVRHALGSCILFLNPDTIVKGDAIQRMLSALKSTPNAGALGCKLLNPDLTLQTTCVLGFPTVMNQLLAIDWLQRKWPTLPLWRKQAIYSAKPSKLQEVDAVSGAAILVRRNVFEEVGGFNPEYFMYAEEVELCYAIHHAGWQVMHLNDAEIIHFGGQSTKNREDSFAAVSLSDSVYLFLGRTRGQGIAILYRAGLFVSAMCRLPLVVCMLLLHVASNRSTAQANQLRIFYKWLAIARWSLWRSRGFIRVSPSSPDRA